jgi:hypothetical protein
MEIEGTNDPTVDRTPFQIRDVTQLPGENGWRAKLEWNEEYETEKYDLNVDMNFILFREAVINSQVDKVRASLAEGMVDPGVLHNWAIRRACDSGALDIVKLLLPVDGVDPAALNSTVVVHAAQKGHEHIMDALLKDGRADPTVDDDHAIRSAATNGHASIVDMLLKDGRSNPSAQNNQALYVAARGGLNDVVTLLLADKRVVEGGGGVAAAFAVADARRGSLGHPGDPSDLDDLDWSSTASLFEGIYDPMAIPPTFAIGSLSLSSGDKHEKDTWTEGQRRALSDLLSSPRGEA